MDLEKEIISIQSNLDALEVFFTLYGNEIRRSNDVVIYSNENQTEFKIEWQRTEYSVYRTAIIKRSGNLYSTVCLSTEEHNDIICCTPESAFGFLEKAIESTSSEILKKKYQMYRAKLEVYENANNH